MTDATNTNWLLLSLALVLSCGLIASAEEVPQTTDAEGVAFFESKIRPLLITHCYECHAGEEDGGGLRLDSRAAWEQGGDSGAAVVRGKPDASRIIEAVRYGNSNLQMPPAGKLANGEIAALERWVSIGAPDPRDETLAPTSAATGMTIEEGRSFWSFRPLADSAPPAVKEPAWVQTPVDAFVLARLEAAGLAPSPPADKRTLIRRATFDLIGLPPSPEEIEAFLADERPDAFERLVERLISSPEYGERWGRHWLDVARYADSNGLDENLAFGNAWRYRDYVIRAFNEDKPFDRFVVEQLAGDLLPEANQETKTATGFLVLGAKVLAEPDREKLWMDTIDEQLDATGKAFLAMTFGCARCHDHKFDPIKQSDYYSLAAIFKSTRSFASTNTGAIQHWAEHSFATEAERARLKEVDQQIAARNAAASKFRGEAMAAIQTQARKDASKYLAAASQLTITSTLGDAEMLAAKYGLHPRILHHCRLHLEYNSADPLFGEWHALIGEGKSPDQIEDHFQSLFELALATSPGKGSGEASIPEVAERLERARTALQDKSGFLAVPVQPEFAFDPATLQQYDRLMEEARLFESQAPDETAAMGVSDGPIVTSLPIHIRGSHHNLGDPVMRAFPEVMRTSAVPPIMPRHQSGRLEFANWVASTQHPLTARVLVNRVWRWHFGSALVESTENFGALADPPSHPELMDWLARQLMESGWSIKSLHRLLMRSSVYQMGSVHPNATEVTRVDPENRLRWKFGQQRLDAEQIRDAVLAVSGRLDATVGGKTVPLRNRQFVFNHTSVDHTRYDSLRRAVYLPIIRNNLYSFFEQLDFPDPTMPMGSRKATV
ncbi:MAG: PSD1 and planctomycete cytochrome C domain-containing protein, partial [Planctomycetaceae bacterium]